MSALDKERAPKFLEFIKLTKRKESVEAETAMLYSQPAVRGILYSMGVILLGKDAPTHWRDNAKRLLFSAERPYFQ